MDRRHLQASATTPDAYQPISDDVLAYRRILRSQQVVDAAQHRQRSSPSGEQQRGEVWNCGGNVKRTAAHSGLLQFGKLRSSLLIPRRAMPT